MITIEPKSFVGLAIGKYITILQPHYIKMMMDLYTTSLKLSSSDPSTVLPTDLQTLFQKKTGNILYLQSRIYPIQLRNYLDAVISYYKSYDTLQPLLI